MLLFVRFCYFLLLMTFLAFPYTIYADSSIKIPILCYHNFNPTKPGSMNLTPQKLETQFKWLKANGFTVIPLREAAEFLQGKRTALPPKPIVITVDDGWKSAYKYLAPLVQKYKIPVTLFVYPETISEGKNAMTWDELRKMQHTGLFDIQSHTYSHPNFKQAKRTLSPIKYEKFVEFELNNAKKILEDKLGTKITFLAWPFGIYDSFLEQKAAQAGYQMAFSIDARPASRSYNAMAQPRFMIIDSQSTKMFSYIVNSASAKQHVVSN